MRAHSLQLAEPPDGMTSIGHRRFGDPVATPVGESLQLAGDGIDVRRFRVGRISAATPLDPSTRARPLAPLRPLPPCSSTKLMPIKSSTDAAEFVELYDGGAGGTDLTGLSIVFFNGSDDASYEAFDLDGLSTNSDGLLRALR